MQAIRDLIETAFENRSQITPQTVDTQTREAILTAINGLDDGSLRVAEKNAGEWQVHEWLKKAVLLFFRIQANQDISSSLCHFYDKVPLKFSGMSNDDWQQLGARVVPPATVRKGAYIGNDVVLMPSYVNIGAFIDSGTMVDTWATVGSCAQIGKNVHISGGAGIGGVLEPLQANPTIIEDDCFIGARSEVVEGVIVEQGAVIGMGVFLGQSTRIYHRETGEISYGRVPAGSVVVPGSLPAKDGSHSLACAVIVKQVDSKTRSKVGVNELLRTV